MIKLHITQDKHGFWMLSSEDTEKQELKIVACHFTRPDHLIHDARELVKDGTFPGATILIDAPRAIEAVAEIAAEEPKDYNWPEPQRAKH